MAGINGIQSEELLYENPIGIKFMYRKRKQRADVCIKSLDESINIMIYRFNNVPLYRHQYLSWQNLDCCGGWSFDKTYLETEAVQKHKKLVAEISRISQEEIDMDKWYGSLCFNASEVDVYKSIEERYFGNTIYRLIVARKGCFADFFNFKEVLSVYKGHDIHVQNMERLLQLWNTPLIDLYSDKGKAKYDFDFKNVYRVEDCIINGLALGYPIESTVGILR